MTRESGREGFGRGEGDAAADDLLLERLRSIAGEVDPIPAHVADAARASFTWRTIDAELAELAYDSALDEERLAFVRSEGGARLLTFEAPELTVEVEVAEIGRHRRIVGQLVPPSAGVVEVHHAGGVLELQADELGRFTAEPLEPGPVSLCCRRAGEDSTPVKTDWITI